MRLLLAIAIGCSSRSAYVDRSDPLVVEPTRAPCSRQTKSVEILPASRNAGSVRIFPSKSGFDLFWTERGDAGQFVLAHLPISADGESRGAPKHLIAYAPRAIAPGEPGRYGVTYHTNDRKLRVAVIQPPRVLWDVAVPSDYGHGNSGLAWDPKARQWLLAGEEQFQVPGQQGHYYLRLFVGRLDERGAWLARPTYHSAQPDSARLSDWANPVIWARDRFAFVWERLGDTPAVFVTEVAGGAVKHIPITTVPHALRATLVHTGAGYTVVAGDHAEDLTARRLFTVTVRDGVASQPRFLSRTSTNEGVIASDGERIAVGWHEAAIVATADGFDNQGGGVHTTVIDAAGTIAPASARSQPPQGQHDWASGLAWDGCRFALVHGNGIYQPSTQLVLFP